MNKKNEKTKTWAEHSLIQITARSFDALPRVVKIKTKTNGTQLNLKAFVWQKKS